MWYQRILRGFPAGASGGGAVASPPRFWALGPGPPRVRGACLSPLAFLRTPGLTPCLLGGPGLGPAILGSALVGKELVL